MSRYDDFEEYDPRDEYDEDEDEEEYYRNNYDEYEPEPYTYKEIEDRFYSDIERYDRTEDTEVRQAHMTRMMGDLDRAIESRQRENEEIGDERGQLDAHVRRIEVLEANKSALALERLYAAQEASEGHNSGWDEQNGKWRDVQEANYEEDAPDFHPESGQSSLRPSEDRPVNSPFWPREGLYQRDPMKYQESEPPIVPSGWSTQWDENEERWFFINRATGEVQWHHPNLPAGPYLYRREAS